MNSDPEIHKMDTSTTDSLAPQEGGEGSSGEEAGVPRSTEVRLGAPREAVEEEASEATPPTVQGTPTKVNDGPPGEGKLPLPAPGDLPTQELQTEQTKREYGRQQPALYELSDLVFRHLQHFETRLADHLASTASCSRAAFDHLYDEMQGYKKNFLREAQRPLLTDLMLLCDSVEKLRQSYETKSDIDVPTLRQNLETLQVEVEEILARSGVERMLATPERLDVRLQQAIKTVSTENPEEHLAVVDRLRAGFICSEQAMRKELVVVKKYIQRI